MNTRNRRLALQKMFTSFSVGALTVGASLILGCLSLSGMYALSPFLPFALAAFGLSVAYEGEVYLQNIKGALEKLFKRNYLENCMAREYLLDNFPEDTDAPNCPQFFKDYKKVLELLAAFHHGELDQESKKRKKQLEKMLRDMEKWFALHLFLDLYARGKASIYARQLQLHLAQHGQQEWQERLQSRRFKFDMAKKFSILAGLLMGIGSTYLIVEAFTVIPFLAAIPFTFWPAMIVPMAFVAGIAYGMLTFNAITDLINNNTVIKWYNKLRHDLRQGITPRTVFMAITATFLVGLAVVLTVFTAGTWWTVATKARPLFEWMRRMPPFIMGIMMPIVAGFSDIFFNIQNTAESLDLVDEALQSEGNIFQKIYNSIVNTFNHLLDTENWLQIVNPFRLILKLTITPLLTLLFLSHVISAALKSRMPGVSQGVSIGSAMVNEIFVDGHYFIDIDDHDHAHHARSFQDLLRERLSVHTGHSHEQDIPTRIIQTIATPLYALAALWDAHASRLNDPHQRRVLSFQQAWRKQRGIPEEEHVELPADAEIGLTRWAVEHTVFLIEQYQNQHLNNIQIAPELAEAKMRELNALKSEAREATSKEELAEILAQASHQPVYNQHRWFSQDNKTSTQMFVEDLPERVNAIGAW